MEREVRKGLSEVATFKQRPEEYSGVGWVGRVAQSRMQDNPFGRKPAYEAIKVGHCDWSIGNEQEKGGKVEIRKVTRAMFYI